MRIERARTRAAAYLARHGARATIERKIGAAWTVIDTDVPMMVEALQGGAAVPVDALESARDGQQLYRLSVKSGYDLRAGDRVRVDSTRDVLTVATVLETSLDVYRQAVALTEAQAVETYPLTFERWSEATGDYAVILVTEGQASADRPATGTDGDGASGGIVTGVVTLSPPPAVALGEGDWIVGIPWATGAQIARVRPVVGARLELDFRATT